MFKQLCNLINKFLFPGRVAKRLSCNDGVWWFIPALMSALGSVGGAIGAGAGAIGSALGGAAGAIGSGLGAIGSGIGSAASAIGSGIGGLFGGGGAAAGTAGSTASGLAAGTAGTTTAGAGGLLGQAGAVGLSSGGASGLTAGGLSGLLGGTGGGVTGGLAGTGTTLAPSLASTATSAATNAALTKAGLEIPTQAAAKFGLKDAAGMILKETLGIDPEAGLKENLSNVAVKQIAGAKDRKTQSPPVTYDNSISMQSPQIAPTPSAPIAAAPVLTGGKVTPSMFQKMLETKKRYASGALGSIFNQGGY